MEHQFAPITGDDRMLHLMASNAYLGLVLISLKIISLRTFVEIQIQMVKECGALLLQLEDMLIVNHYQKLLQAVPNVLTLTLTVLTGQELENANITQAGCFRTAN